MAESFHFEKLLVYRKSIELVDLIYQYTDSFPKSETFGLCSQFRRSGVSIALNIAEGTARSKKDFRRMLDISQGSVLECVAIAEICKRRQYMTENTVSQIRCSLAEISKMLSGLKRSLVTAGRNES